MIVLGKVKNTQEARQAVLLQDTGNLYFISLFTATYLFWIVRCDEMQKV